MKMKIFKNKCPSCKLSLSEENETRYNKGYNFTCHFCGTYIYNENLF